MSEPAKNGRHVNPRFNASGREQMSQVVVRDHAILAAAILHSLGHDVALFWLDLGDSVDLALGYRAEGFVGGGFSEVAEGKAYYYVETVPAQSGDRVGDMASKFLKDLKSTEVILV